MLKIPRLPIAQVAAALVAVLLLVWIGSKCVSDRSDYDRARAAWEAERGVLRAQVEAGRVENAALLARVRDDSVRSAPIIAHSDVLLAQLARERSAKVAALNALAARQRELADTTEMSRIAAQAIAAAHSARAEADTLSRAMTSLRGVVDRQMQNLAALSGNLTATQARADSCATLLGEVPVYKGDRLLGLIQLPSRTASLVIGLVTGAAAVVVARR